MRYSTKGILATVKYIVLTVVGTVVLAFGTAVFILPMNIISGGLSGIAVILDRLLPFEFISIDLIVFVLTWLLFLIGLFALGKSFAAKTLLSALIYPAAVSLFLRLGDPEVLGGFFNLSGYGRSDLTLILSASVGGALVGLGCALTFMGGGSTGGVDVLAFLICRFFPRLRSSVVIFLIDAITVVAGMLVIKDLILSLVGILSAFVSALTVDKVFVGGRAAFVAYVVTERYDELNKYVIEQLSRTTTALDVTGGYSRKKMKMLMVSFSISQYAQLLNIINEHDPQAFVVVHRAHEINGEGWRK